jgi:Bacteriophage HK97-gp10, putative tail-component
MYRHLQGDLVALFDQDGVPPLLRQVADLGGARFTELAAAHTPVDTGELAEGWAQLPVERIGYGGEAAYRSGAENSTWYAHFIEYGVEPHTIERDDGGVIEHPGHEGAHMTTKAAAELEETLDLLVSPHLGAWARAQEARASAERRGR